MCVPGLALRIVSEPPARVFLYSTGFTALGSSEILVENVHISLAPSVCDFVTPTLLLSL